MNVLPLIVAAVVVLGLAVALVFWPLWRKPDSAVDPAASETLAEVQELEAARDHLYRAIRDLEFDHQVGKVSDEDYEVFAARYKHQAAEVLRRLAALTDGPASRQMSLDAVLEAEIQARRQTLRPPSADGQYTTSGPGAAITAVQSTAARYCTLCGHAVGPNDRFCAHCGTPLQR